MMKIPFILSGTGDKLCFRIVNTVIDGKIYIWYHETEWGKKKRLKLIMHSLLGGYFNEAK